ncbi:MAG: hypothetical protein JWP24_2877 [Marmoricola sp.]|nr:hypothetical protein [Marmoricola sp.]
MRCLAALCLLLGLLAPAPAGVPSASPQHVSRPDLLASLEVLHAWDARRAQAWADVDAKALGSLYQSGSAAGQADVRLLRAYRARGFVVRRLVTQVFAVEVLHSDATTLTLWVFDRVAGGEMVRAGRVAPLRSSPPVTRTVELRRESGAWRVASVSDSGGGPRAARHGHRGPGG